MEGYICAEVEEPELKGDMRGAEGWVAVDDDDDDASVVDVDRGARRVF